jgi:hypothetical protein
MGVLALSFVHFSRNIRMLLKLCKDIAVCATSYANENLAINRSHKRKLSQLRRGSYVRWLVKLSWMKTAVHIHVKDIIFSRVRGSVTNNIGFCIGWFDLLALLLQLLLTAHNRRLLKTSAIPSWTTSVFSSIMTDLHEWRLSYESLGDESCEWITCPFITSWRPETEHSPERFVCCIVRTRCHGNVC